MWLTATNRFIVLWMTASLLLFNCVAMATVPSKPKIGRCHMDYCSWHRELSKDVIGWSVKGILLKVTLLGGESFHRNGNYGTKTAIKWNRRPHEVYVFCSKFLPVVIISGSNDSMQIDFLPLNPEGSIPGALESSYGLYVSVCHSTDRVSSEQLTKRFGYNASEDEFSKIEKRLRAPTDILQ